MIIIHPLPEGGGGYTVLPLSVPSSVLPSVQHIFRRIFLSNCWWQKSDILSQASYRYTILWVAFLDPSDSYFLFADLVGLYTHWTYMLIFLSNYWWQKSDIWSQASYRYPISWEAFLDPSDPTSCLLTLLIFIHIEHICSFFSATIDGRNLIFGHKLHIGTPYRGKRFFDPLDSYFLFAKERGYHRWALAHSSSCCVLIFLKLIGYLMIYYGVVWFIKLKAIAEINEWEAWEKWPGT
jgi:hypothetical protein